jgi:hypothetical protein
MTTNPFSKEKGFTEKGLRYFCFAKTFTNLFARKGFL